MGCYWYCDCTFKTDKDISEKIKDWINENYSDSGILYYDFVNGAMCVGYTDHASYGFGEEFSDLMCKVAEAFSLDGEMYIRTDEDEGEPPWKTTFESGKTVQWIGKVVYVRVTE